MALLKRDDFPTAAVVGSDLNALLGKGTEFDGKLSFEGTARIDGKFTGTIHTKDTLVVGEGAKVSAEISCGTIIVHGEVHGTIKASVAVELHQPARVYANIDAPMITIAKGVVFNGQCKMTEEANASSAAMRPSASPPPPPLGSAVPPAPAKQPAAAR